jgi:ParB/RepB/Spo0J family partition protein
MPQAANKTAEPPATNAPEEILISKIGVGKNIRLPSPKGVKQLAESIAEIGVLQEVLVARRLEGLAKGEEFLLVSGHRRLAAAEEAGLRRIPARVIDATDSEIPLIQLHENDQREDISALDRAHVYQDYLDAGHTQAELAKAVSRSQPFVSSTLRLLGLAPKVVKQIADGGLSDSHAEVIARLPPAIQTHMASAAVRKDWSVRQLEQEAAWKARRYQEAQQVKEAFEARVAKSSFPTCQATVLRNLGGNGPGETPCACGRKALREDFRHGDWVTCGLMDHAWSLKTGKTPDEDKTPAAEKREEPPRPELPEVLAETPFAASPDDVARELLGGRSLTKAVAVYPDGKKGHVVLVLLAPGKAFPKDLPTFALGNFGNIREFSVATPGKAWMHGCDSWEQQTDGTRKKLAEAKQLLEAWGTKISGARPSAPRPKKKAKK